MQQDNATTRSIESREGSGVTIGAILLFTPTPGVASSGVEKGSVEDVLENGLWLAESSQVHLALRGTASGSSLSCEWRGVARAAAQRQAAARSWLGLDAAAPLPRPEHVERLFLGVLGIAEPAYPKGARASFRALACGGVSDDLPFLACYIDYAGSEYVLGAGPTRLAVAFDRISESKPCDLYWRAHAAGKYGTGS